VAHATSTGIVLLAHASDEHQRQLLRTATFPSYTGRTPVLARDLRARLARALDDDFAVACDTIEYGAITLAVPVRNGQGSVVAALNCASTTRIVDEKKIVATRLAPLRDAARKIVAMLLRYPALAHSVLP